MADHFRATGYMMMKWAKTLSNHCNVELHEWFPDAGEMTKWPTCLKSLTRSWTTGSVLGWTDGLARSFGKMVQIRSPGAGA
jgi:hypothetical protein